jgi:hypothetical protein
MSITKPVVLIRSSHRRGPRPAPPKAPKDWGRFRTTVHPRSPTLEEIRAIAKTAGVSVPELVQVLVGMREPSNAEAWAISRRGLEIRTIEVPEATR